MRTEGVGSWLERRSRMSGTAGRELMQYGYPVGRSLKYRYQEMTPWTGSSTWAAS